MNYLAFSDESNPTKERFRSISVLTLPESLYTFLSSEISNIMMESNIKEFKWKKTDSAKYRFAAIKIINYLMPYFISSQIRIDTLIWDIEDPRHKIKNRDDKKNFGRLYYRVFNNVLDFRWPNDSDWEIYPDQMTLINWELLEQILIERSPIIFSFDEEIPFSFSYNISKLKQVDSKETPLVQVADLFAGIASYTKNNFQKKQIADDRFGKQIPLFPVDDRGFSNADHERWQIIFHLNNLCKKNKMRVAFETTNGFETKDPSYGINFWLYKPQGDYDKAPVKD